MCRVRLFLTFSLCVFLSFVGAVLESFLISSFFFLLCFSQDPTISGYILGYANQFVAQVLFRECMRYRVCERTPKREIK